MRAPRLGLWVAGLLSLGLTGPVGALAPGDDLAVFYRSHEKAYTAARVLTPVDGYPGYETAVLATDAAFSKPPFVLVLRRQTGAVVVPFGTVEGTAGQAFLVLDTDGDGKVDLRTVHNLVPGWLVLKIPGRRGDGRAFRALSDRIYRQYDQNGGPVPAQLTLLVQSLKASAVNEADPDRDLDAALATALDHAVVEPALAAGTLGALSAALKTRGGDHPLPALYRGEALVALGRLDEAQAVFDHLLALDPHSTIGVYKKAQSDPALLAAFRQAHPEFWTTRE